MWFQSIHINAAEADSNAFSLYFSISTGAKQGVV